VTARSVAKAYPRGPRVLHSVSLDIREGESVALIGSNGSGKSTLLKCLAGVHLPDEGEVTVFGRSFGPRASRAALTSIRAATGFVFQNHGLVRRLSVLSNVVQGRLGPGGSWRALHQSIAPAAIRAEAMDALDRVGLADKAGARADALSGGQAQRVAIARALVRKPRLIIADEPAASLDPVAGADVMQAFAEVARHGATTLIFTTHDLDHALDHARRVIALKAGRVVMDRPTRGLVRADLAAVYQ
jgi:phosphonate transport system ATP-binding protein